MDTPGEGVGFCFRIWARSRVQVVPELSGGMWLDSEAPLPERKTRCYGASHPLKKKQKNRGHREKVKRLNHCSPTQAHKMATLPGGGVVRIFFFNSLKTELQLPELCARKGYVRATPVSWVAVPMPLPHPAEKKNFFFFSRRCSFGTEPRLSPQCPTGLGVFRLRSRMFLAPQKTMLPCVVLTPAHNALPFPEGLAALVIAC